ncbi:hypothetical protein G6F31_016323 [Rhizopus arrhizus]|nr:hypothetical protein G6F31_016323 [Rhizopus arrhizus]KAG1392954.1 hypothetical protein G6F59_014476 [Rhizopus arrhizus]
MNPNVQDRFVHVIAHEYVHVQQTGLTDFEPGDPHATVLRVSLGEGIAEFITELISGNVGNGRHAAWTRGREVHIESAFALDLDSTDLSPWLYNYTPGSQEPYDLGYWVGYRIAKAYYLQARDKRDAVRALIQQDNPKAILAASGWTPGMWMPAKTAGLVIWRTTHAWTRAACRCNHRCHGAEHATGGGRTGGGQSVAGQAC